MIIGITGGMGCGKSSAAALFAERGFARLDSDSLVRERVLCDPEILAAIHEKFGDEVFRTNSANSTTGIHGAATEPETALGELDRARLAERVFASDDARLWLEALTHPRLFALWREALCEAPRITRWVIEVPLLFEKHLENWFDLTVCVASSAPQQIARLERRGVVRELAQQRIFTQLPLATKLSLADIVLWNDGALTSLQRQVEQVITQLSHGRND